MARPMPATLKTHHVTGRLRRSGTCSTANSLESRDLPSRHSRTLSKRMAERDKALQRASIIHAQVQKKHLGSFGVASWKTHASKFQRIVSR